MAALSNIRVLDLSRLLPGPFASMLLRGMGATVDKVEDPARGDYLRNMEPTLDGENPCFRVLCAGNRSLVLDLASDDGRRTLLALLPQYDVLLDSFRPGVMARWGLDSTALFAAHPRIVHCAISGFGAHGPARAGHDLNFLAEAGVLALAPEANGVPTMPGVQSADVGAAMLASARICSALFHREKTGVGAFIDVSMREAAEMFGLFSLSSVCAGDDHAAGKGPFNGGLAVYNVYRCRDGRALAVAALEPKFLRNLAFITGVELPAEALRVGSHQESLKQALGQAFAEHPASHWLERAAAHECCLSLVANPAERAWPIPKPRAPRRGEHTGEILGSLR